MVWNDDKKKIPIWKVNIYIEDKPYALFNYRGTVQSLSKRIAQSLTNDKYAKGQKIDANQAQEIRIEITKIGVVDD